MTILDTLKETVSKKKATKTDSKLGSIKQSLSDTIKRDKIIMLIQRSPSAYNKLNALSDDKLAEYALERINEMQVKIDEAFGG